MHDTTPRTVRRLVVLTASLILGLAAVAGAQAPAENEVLTPLESLRGLRANEPFLSTDGIETINPSNGNLMLSIPLGQTYSVGPVLSYQLRVTHNADVWDHVTVRCEDVTEPQVCTVIAPWRLSVPNGSSNAGIGWELHLGKLYAPAAPSDAFWTEKETWPNHDPSSIDEGDRWRYVSPDGAARDFYRLADWPGSDQGTRYTKDGTFMRLVPVSPTLIEVQSSDGLVSRFLKTDQAAGTSVCGPSRASGCWRFHEMMDGYGNFVRAAYAVVGEEEIWKITDSTGRSHRIVFALDAATVGRFDATPNQLLNGEGSQLGDLRRVVKRVELAAFGGQTATYTFHTAVRKMSRGCPNNTDTLGNVVFHPDNFTIDVPVLERIDFPEGEGFTFETTSTAFAGCSDLNGLIASMLQPNQGKVAYTYGNWQFPTRCTYVTNPDAELTYTRLGVFRKETFAIGASSPEATWTYRSNLVGDPKTSGSDCRRFDYRATWIDEPDRGGSFTRRYFYTNLFEGPQHPLPSTPITDPQVTDYGLPYRKDASVTRHGSEKFLSRQLFTCPTAGAACTLEQRTFVRYEMAFRTCTRTQFGVVDSSACYRVNPVRAAELREFHAADPGKHIERSFFGYDGAGNLATTLLRDNYDGPVRTVRSETDYTATGLSLAADPVTGYFDLGTPSSYLPAATADWVLGRFSQRRVTDSGRTYYTDFQHDAQGQLTCTRQRKGYWLGSGPVPGRRPQDLVTKLTRNGQGLVVTETVAGGDQGILESAVCSTQGSSAAGTRFDTTHTYQHRTLASSRIGTFPYSYRATVDRSSGLPSALFDPSDKRTDLIFDRLGRVSRVTPESSLGQAYTTVTYFNLVGKAPRVDIRVYHPITDEQQHRMRFWHDHRGRVFKEGTWMPTSAGAVEQVLVKRTYDPAGNLTKETTQQPKAGHDLNKSTRYADYDAFGRATRITQPDGQIETIAFSGDRRSARTMSVRTTEGGFSSVTTTAELDGLGRLLRHITPEHTLTNVYDPLGNVVEAKRRQGAASQKRTFGWDGRGRKTFEDLPEIGSAASTTGRVTYVRDALGNPRRIFDGQRWLDHDYDGAGRRTAVREGSLPWQTFVWGTANAAGDVRKGKLVSSTRYNYLGGDTWAFVETYIYGSALGAISQKTLQLEHPNRTGPDRYGARFTQRYTHDPLGFRLTVTYPFCETAPQTGQQYCNDPYDLQGPTHVVDLAQSFGQWTTTASRLGPRVDAIYHGNGQVAKATYGNGTHDLFDQGHAGMVRPARIRTVRTSNGAVLFDTGVVQFDAAGNIWAAGSDRYTYDGAGRLISGTVKRAGAGRRADFRYDAFDNLTGFREDGSAVWQDLAVDAKNRLTVAIGEDDIVYDNAGQLTYRGRTLQNPFTRHSAFAYDALGMQTRHTIREAFGTLIEDYIYLYGPGNYRVLVFDGATGRRHWKLRDIDGKPLRELWVWQWGPYESPSSPGERWTFERDFLYGPDGMFATIGVGGIERTFHRDHLGSTRMITDRFSNKVYEAAFYPFGEEVTVFGSVGEDASKFTGHERDRNGTTDYMLGRTYGADLRRFYSPDPGRDGWNLYGYVRGNPIGLVDPTGQEGVPREVTITLGTTALGFQVASRIQESKARGFDRALLSHDRKPEVREALRRQGRNLRLHRDYKNLLRVRTGVVSKRAALRASARVLGRANPYVGVAVLVAEIGNLIIDQKKAADDRAIQEATQINAHTIDRSPVAILLEQAAARQAQEAARELADEEDEDEEPQAN